MRILLVTSVLISLSGCAIFDIPFADKKPETQKTLPAEQIINRWWVVFNDPMMDRLADELLKQNLDIQIAKTRIDEARGLLKTEESGWFPSVDANGSVSRGNNRFGTDKIVSISQGGFNAQWELDIFGQTKSSVSAADARVAAQVASADDIKNIMLSELMRGIIEWRQAEETIRETKELLASQDNQIQLFKARSEAGLIDATFLIRAQAERSQTATRLPVAQASADSARFKIDRLLAIPAEQLAFSSQEHVSFSVPEVNQATGISIDMVRERPDIEALRAQMIAAQADLAKAEADLWPRLTIGAFFGLQEGSGGLPMAANPVWLLRSAISAPILNFGRLRGAVDAADARSTIASLNYENGVLLALQETQTALSDYLNGINAVTEQEKALASRKDTVTLATERFEQGITDMTDLTTAQSELNNTTITLIERRAVAAIAFIRLQKALGISVLANKQSYISEPLPPAAK